MRNEEQGAFFFGPAEKKPGYPLQVLSPPSAGLRAFRFYPSRMGEQRFAKQIVTSPSRMVARRGTAFGGSRQNVALWGCKHVLRCGRRLVCKRLLVTRRNILTPSGTRKWLLQSRWPRPAVIKTRICLANAVVAYPA
ncbi:MAG: hypothetical protein LBT33_02110, partial [Spirochaetia bacterium]|nr:hypothetical protein [Spirochaetia bacterium]